jgi:predicted AlkP superfamily phosphohydrolase/phosphomutase/tetratricopeptide (TPR) repeat protein
MTVIRAGSVCALALLVALSPAGCRRGEEPATGRAASTGPAVTAVEDEDVGVLPPHPPSQSRRVIWLGLDGFDWDLVDRLAREGRMPSWSRLASEGFTANLASFFPVLSPVIWTTVATGVGPDVHRVLDFQETDPKTGVKLPVSGMSRAVPAVWNIASEEGRKVGVVGWWATHPAEEVNGFFVSDRASPLLFGELPRAGAAFPASLGAGVEQLVARDNAVTDAELTRFIDVPTSEIAAARASGAGMENVIVGLARIVGSTRVNHHIARELYDRYRPDLMTLYLEGTDEIGHVFAPYSPPRLACTSEADYAKYHRAVEVYFGLVDRILGQWMRRAKEDGATLVVNSDHGFKWGEDRTCERSSANWATAAYWHRLNGVFAAWGAHVRPSATRAKLSVFDLAPTVLALLDLPVDRRMSGKAATEAFEGVSTPAKKDLFAKVPVRRVSAVPLSGAEASEYSKKLRALGYLTGSETQPIAPAGGDRPGMTEGAYNNLGVYLRETVHDLKDAESALLKALELKPGYHSPIFNLAVLYRTKGEDAKATDWLFRSLEAGHAEPERTLTDWVAEYEDKKRFGPAIVLLERATAKFPENEPFARELGLLRFRERHDCPGALNALSRFEARTTDVDTLNALGLFQTCLGHRREAIALFERSLAMKSDQPAVVESLNLVRRGI